MRAATLPAVVALAAAAIVATTCGPGPPPDELAESSRSVLPDGAPSDWFTPMSIGTPFPDGERPEIAHVQIVDLDEDGLADVVACDVVRNRVIWFRQDPVNVYTEHPLGGPVPAPAHAEVVDFDRDGDRDVLVASLGVLPPDNRRIGSVVVLDNDGALQFTNRTLIAGIARVADARAGDLDGDGDLDVAVAGFGYDEGATSWLENQGGWSVQQHVLLRLSGPINAIITDINDDHRPDVVALVSQEWEEVWAFIGQAPGEFELRTLWGSSNADFGSSWITLADMDQDGDLDILHSNGDAFDYAPANSRPWHGVQWLENLGDLTFQFHRIADLPGASSPQAADLDADGDIDVVVSSAYNAWNDPTATSLAWLENDGRMQFTQHQIATSPTHLITVAVGDLDGNGTPDLVTGGMHVSRPYDRMSRVTVWSNRGPSTQP